MITDLKTAFKIQGENCLAMGSPFMAKFCSLCALHLESSGAVGEKLFNWSEGGTEDIGPFGASLPLRLAGALHALVLDGISTPLSLVYPPEELYINDDKLWQAIEQALNTHADFILERLKSPPQTNELRRSCALLPGFLTIADTFKLPLVLSEVGASTGLNMLWDRYQYTIGDRQWGDLSSPISLTPEWRGSMPPLGAVTVQERAGCDLAPIDASSPSQSARMLSYIWPDQTERIGLIRGALNMAAIEKPAIEKADALSWLKKRLSNTHEGACHVIYHTIMWQYMSPDDQMQGKALITQAGEQATASAPLAWLRMEADDKEPGAAITLTEWPSDTEPSGIERYVGRADFHGRWVHWF